MNIGYTLWRSGCSCDGNRGLLSRITVDGRLIAILGLDLIFQELYAMGQTPDIPGLDARLLEMVETTWHDRPSYVPDEVLAQALLREYGAYCAQFGSG